MPAIFDNENDIRNYILQAAYEPANVKVTADGKRRLNYRNYECWVGSRVRLTSELRYLCSI